MHNYNKIGYSVSEVAQIFGCTPSTVRSYINKGYLKADTTIVNERHNIRIRREHLIEYMKKHRERFSKELLDQFKITDYDEAKNSDNTVEFAPGAYAAKDVSELTGAWGNKQRQSKAKTEKKYPAYDIMIDGNVVISGCEKFTVGKIVDALITDRNLEITNISIVRK